MLQVTRRKALTTIAGFGGVTALAACTTNPTTGYPEIDPNFITAVQNGVAQIAKFIPTATSIANVVAALFGPAAVAIVQTITGALSAVINDLVSAAPTTPAASAQLRARLRASSAINPITIGVTAHGVTVAGYKV